MATIVKSDGAQQEFDRTKLEHSLKRAGASEEVVRDILEMVERELVEGMTTQDIYHRAYALLAKQEHHAASRYSLRRALLLLGPTGYPFEDFVGEIFRTQGYKVLTRTIYAGKCTTHELDVIAEKDGSRIGAELKFHNDVGMRTDLKVALYVRARFDDLHTRHMLDPNGATPLFDEVYLITNTKFTAQAIEYALCAGMKLIGWNYPSEGNLQDLVERAHVQPVTSLVTLSNAQKHRLLEEGVVLCRSIPERLDTLRAIGLSEHAIQSTLAEVEHLNKL